MSRAATAQARHDELVEQAAQRYQNAGYEVFVNAHGSSFGWEASFVPDLVARKGDESVAVEVASRESLRGRKALRDFARELDAMPGWRFELVLSDSLEEPELGSDVGHSVSRKWLTEVEQLGAAGHWEAATLIAAAALEAVLRNSAATRGVALGRASPREVLRTAASLGDIDESEFAELDRMWRVRNELAHGFSVPGDAPRPLSEIATYLAATGRRVLDQLESEARERQGEVRDA